MTQPNTTVQVFVRDAPGVARNRTLVLRVPYDSTPGDVAAALAPYHGSRNVRMRFTYGGRVLTNTLRAHGVQNDSTLHCVGVSDGTRRGHLEELPEQEVEKELAEEKAKGAASQTMKLPKQKVRAMLEQILRAWVQKMKQEGRLPEVGELAVDAVCA